MVNLVDPLRREAIEQGRAGDKTTAADILGLKGGKRKVTKPLSSDTITNATAYMDDFRLFMILGWRRLLNVDPAPIMLDMAYQMQHGDPRMVIEAFRGFSKSWIAGLFSLWLLLRNPQEKVMVLSGALDRAVAMTNWCLTLILTWPLLENLKPHPDQRQSSKAFDVGPATPEQSPSFHALGIGGQAVGFRSSFILGDDVETNKNSITVPMRDKIADAVKEFGSVLLPGGRTLYLGTPHDEDSLYNKLPSRGYTVLVYPALFPTEEQIKNYGPKLAKYVIWTMRKLGPGCVGRSTMPTRFTDDDLANRKRELGSSEFALQFMLDTSMSDANKYPLKAKDLVVMSLDPRQGPERVVWSGDVATALRELPAMGFEGDHYHGPLAMEGVRYQPYNRIVGFVDSSGRGSDETALAIVAELNGNVFWLYLWASKGGFEISTLLAIAKACVRFKVNKLLAESNFGGGMFSTLLSPVLIKEWDRANKASGRGKEPGGTEVVDIRASNLLTKEQRILGVLEPVTQSHRLIVARDVIEWDYQSITQHEGEDTRHRYAAMHQFTHITKVKDALGHDDRLDALAGAVADFADVLGVDPGTMADTKRAEMDDEEYEKLFGDLDEDSDGVMGPGKGLKDHRPRAVRPQQR